MKACPICGSTYDDRVDFCFRDGAPLIARAAEDLPHGGAALPEVPDPMDAPDPASMRGEDLPEPKSLGVLPDVAEDLPEPGFLSAPGDGVDAPPSKGLYEAPTLPFQMQDGAEDLADPAPVAPPNLAGPDVAAPESAAPGVDDAAAVPPPVLSEDEAMPAPTPVTPPLPEPADSPPSGEPAPILSASPAAADDDDLPDDDSGIGFTAAGMGGEPDYAAMYADEPPANNNSKLFPALIALALFIVVVGSAAVLIGNKDKGGAGDLETTASNGRSGDAGSATTRAGDPAGTNRAGSAEAGGTPGNAAGENAAGENAAGDNAAGDDAAGDNAAGDNAAGDDAAVDDAAGDDAPVDGAAGDDPAADEPAVADEPIAEPATPPAASTKSKASSSSPRSSTSAASTKGAEPWDTPTSSASTSAVQPSLTVSTTPAGAVVSIDGRRVGNSPVTVPLDKGNHVVRAENDGYTPAQSTVAVEGEGARIALTLQKKAEGAKKGVVTFYGPPEGGVVKVNGQTTSLGGSLLLAEGSYTFEVSTANSQYKIRRDVAFNGADSTKLILNPN